VSPSRTPPYRSIVLRTIDVGEADRFCIFFTRERGRLSARARAVRKLRSRMGAALQPLRLVSVELVEKDGHATVVGASALEHQGPPEDYRLFLPLQQGVELLLLLTEEDAPLPEAFDLLEQFLQLGRAPSPQLLPTFQLCLLHALGLLPATIEDPRFARLPPAAQSFVTRCTRTADLSLLVSSYPSVPALHSFLRSVLESQLSRPLRSESLGGSIFTNPHSSPPGTSSGAGDAPGKVVPTCQKSGRA
jgi:hypothetical protein